MLVVQLLGAGLAGCQCIIDLGLLQLIELGRTEGDQHCQVHPRQHGEDLAQLADHNQRDHDLQTQQYNHVRGSGTEYVTGCWQYTLMRARHTSPARIGSRPVQTR
jgi:hypothetical protein